MIVSHHTALQSSPSGWFACRFPHMHSLMAFATDNQRLASSSGQDMHPLWFFSLPLVLEVCQPAQQENGEEMSEAQTLEDQAPLPRRAHAPTARQAGDAEDL